MSEATSTTATPADGAGHGARRDDLTRIGGIDAVAADRLALAGIPTYADVAGHSAEELAGISGLPPERAINWPSQARELAAATDAPASRAAPADGVGHHYESFVWRLLLDPDGTIRHTSVQHVQTGEVKRWAWWNREALLDFVESRAAAGSARPPEAATEPCGAEPGRTEPAGTEPAAREPGDVGGARADATDTATTGYDVPRVFPTLTGSLGIDRAEVLPARPLTMILTLDLAGVDPPDSRLGYDATVVARRLPDDSRSLVGRAAGTLDVTRPVILVAGDGLPAGLYRLEAAVALHGPDGTRCATAMIDGVLLEVPADLVGGGAA